MNDKIVRFPEVCEILGGVSRQTVYDMIKRGDFPKPFKLSENGRAVGWRASTVEAWLEERASTAEEMK